MKHIIFDLWGTLADTDASLLHVKRGDLMNWGLDKWCVRGVLESEFFEEYCSKTNTSAQKLKEEFSHMEKSAAFFEGIPEVLQLLSKTYHLHLLSNTGKSVESFLAKYPDIFSQFTTITFSFQEEIRKPNKEIFQRVLKKAHAQPYDCISIGNDIEADLKPAEELGMKTIYFNGRKENARMLHSSVEKLGRKEPFNT